MKTHDVFTLIYQDNDLDERVESIGETKEERYGSVIGWTRPYQYHMTKQDYDELIQRLVLIWV